MSKQEPIKSLLQVKHPFKKTIHIWFHAPYSLSDEATLPERLLLSVREYKEREEPYRFEASPVDSKAWAPFLISSSNRFDKNFRHGYNFHLTQSEIDQYCEVVEHVPETKPEQIQFHHAIQGCLFGTAVADAIGLPFEGISPRRLKKLKAIPLRHRFLFGRGMISDDTEHTCIVAQSLIHAKDDPAEFSEHLAWNLRWWFLGLPAGIGMATLRACLKLWLFRPANKSGVFSAGNGPAMRSALIGVYAYDDQALRAELIRINTCITHTDPKAIKGALIVAELAARNTQGNPITAGNCYEALKNIIQEDDELKILINSAIESAKQNEPALDYCQQLNQTKGVSGYIYHTLPVVLQIVLRHNNDYEQAITEAISCGGDTDTVAAIIGGIVGANVGKDKIPEEWLENLKDWPRNKTYIRLLGEELAMVKWLKQEGRTQIMDIIRIWIRNAFFMVWVLAHGFRRLLPPY